LLTSSKEIKEDKNNLLSSGIKNMLMASFYFSIVNVLVKLLSNIPSYEVALFRTFVSLIMSWVMIRQAAINPWGNNKKDLLLRGFFGTISLLLYFYTLQNMPLASAVTIQYLSPIFTTILATFILKEKTKSLHWLFFLISFSGVLIIKGFDTRLSSEILFLGIISAFTSGMAYNFVRKLKDTDHPIVTVFYFPLVSVPIIAPYALFHWIQPYGIEWLYLILVGVFTQQAQVHMTKAYQSEKISIVANFNYTGIIFALGMGYIVFGEGLNVYSIMGTMTIITGAFLISKYK
jgi:drug/metabolite transporter (DMT)-like permease